MPEVTMPGRDEMEATIKRVFMLMSTGYLPRQLMDDLQKLLNAAAAYQIMLDQRSRHEHD